MDAELKELYDDIIRCLIRYGHLTRKEAWYQLDKSGLFDNVETEAARAALVHETGYYWAMSMIYARDDPQWFQNPDLWPPPDDYYEGE